MTNFPTSLDSLPNPTGSDLMENATAALDHDVQHSNANDAIEALEAKVESTVLLLQPHTIINFQVLLVLIKLHQKQVQKP